MRGVVVIALCLMTACKTGQSEPAHVPSPASAVAAKPDDAPRPERSARQTLSSYVRATLDGEHGRAWDLLSTEDHARYSRAAYMEREQANDRLRRQVSALGKMRQEIVGVRETGDTAIAIVTISSGLGTDTLRFSLKRERGKWRVVYAASWESI